MSRLTLIAGALAAAIVGVGVWWMYAPHGTHMFSPGDKGPMVQVSVPDLSAAARAGKGVFDESCASCHGVNAAGSNQGPPLVHKIYEPNHHGDAAFYAAVQLGVRAHHWSFGSMPAVEGVSKRDVSLILRYIRDLQKANDIF